MSLEGDVFGPSDEPGEVSFGLDVVADAEVARSFLEERIDFLLNLLSSLFSFNCFALS